MIIPWSPWGRPWGRPYHLGRVAMFFQLGQSQSSSKSRHILIWRLLPTDSFTRIFLNFESTETSCQFCQLIFMKLHEVNLAYRSSRINKAHRNSDKKSSYHEWYKIFGQYKWNPATKCGNGCQHQGCMSTESLGKIGSHKCSNNCSDCKHWLKNNT